MNRLVFNGEESWFPARYINVKTAYPDARNSRIFTAYDTIEQREVVIKKISDRFGDVINAKHVCREFFLLNSVSHPNIIKLLDAYTPQHSVQDFSDIYLVTEKMDMSLIEILGCQLKHDYISFLVYQMLCGVNHLHQSNIIHRNLNLTSIVVDDKCQLKILDFGLARNFDEIFLAQTPYVIPRYYRAPEIILGLEYDKKVDIWSIGCIFAELITGDVLFFGSTSISQWEEIVKKLGSPSRDFVKNFPFAIRQQIESHTYLAKSWNELFPDEVFPKENCVEEKNLNDLARDLLSKMLVIDPTKRISIEEALQHPYVSHNNGPENFATYLTQNNVFIENEHYTANYWRTLLFNELKKYEYMHNVSNFTNWQLPQYFDNNYTPIDQFSVDYNNMDSARSSVESIRT